ncbi:MAG: hydantoin utilization protein A [Cyanobacteria bacterium K_DeepCast_35m_m2_023]|nr:hydantoin utilization protein A [Cyanobacteria bacterium K_DeepCast_35m_m2_023]
MQRFNLRALPLLGTSAAAIVLLSAGAAEAHHLADVNALAPTPLNGLLSGLAHPVLGPDHLVFLLALSLVGLQHRRRWMGLLLIAGLVGSLAGVLVPGLPGAEVVLALTLMLEALTLLGRLPAWVLLPAMALHGYALSGAVVGWTTTHLFSYFAGLLLSQGLLLLLALTLVQRAGQGLGARWRACCASLLIGLGGSLAIAQVLA